MLRLGSEADDQSGTVRRGGDGGENVGIFDQRQRRSGTAILLHLLPRRLDPPVGDGGDHHGGIGGQRVGDRLRHVARGFDIHAGNTRRVGSVTGPATSVTRAPSAASAPAIAKPCRPEERLAM